MRRTIRPLRGRLAPTAGRAARGLVLALACFAAAAALAPAPAQAQDNRESQRIWLEIFAAPAPAPAPETRTRRSTRPSARRTAPAARRTAPAAATTAAATTANSPAAPAGDVPVTQRIVVFGDSLATNLGDGLADVLADQPQVAVTTRARGSSGLVRDDYHDWRAEIEPFFEGETPVDIGVVLVGLNDRQDLAVDGARLERLTDPWKEAYAERVDAILERFAAARVPLVWVGLPPMSSSRLSGDMQAINEIVRSRVTRADGIFVDIWQGFVDDENRYSANGPTLEGQIGRLRAGDGIHFTPPGARKAAHFVDVEIRRLISRAPEAAAPDVPIGVAVLDDISIEDMSVDEIVARLTGLGLSRSGTPEGTSTVRPVIGPVLPLTGVERTPGAALARGRPATDRATRLLNERVLSDGLAPPPVPGRADDFTWPQATVGR